VALLFNLNLINRGIRESWMKKLNAGLALSALILCGCSTVSPSEYVSARTIEFVEVDPVSRPGQYIAVPRDIEWTFGQSRTPRWLYNADGTPIHLNTNGPGNGR
jgi:hypothetical protein